MKISPFTESGVQRANYKRQLALRWIKEHRPDIMSLIDQEAEKKFPRKAAQKLPASLRGDKHVTAS